MSELTRRRACRSALGVISGTLLAGCSSGSDSSDEFAPGESVTANALEITYEGYELVSEIEPTTPSDSSNETTDSDDDSRETPITGSDDEAILGLEFSMQNGADEERSVPMPKPAPVFATGEISVSIDVAKYERRDEPSIQFGPETELNGTTVESLNYELGQRQANLPAGEGVSGWAFYPVPDDVEPSDVQAVISGTEFEVQTGNEMVKWRVAEQ